MRRKGRQQQTQNIVATAKRFHLIRITCQNTLEFGRVALSCPKEIHTVQYQLTTIIQIKLNQPAEIICPVQQRVKIKRKRIILLTQPRLGIESFRGCTR